MRNLIWSREALEDLDRIIEYIQERNFAAADRMRSLIRDAAAHLPDHPYIHRAGRIAGTREAVVHPNYLLIYTADAVAVTILGVLHARQQYP